MKKSRRNFIKNSLAGLAGMAVLPSGLASKGKTQEQEKTTARKLIFRTLGKTGIKLPLVSAGLLSTDENIYRAALDAGIIYIDGGYDYGNGQYETAMGKAVKGRPRDSYVIATKIGGQPQDPVTGLFTKETSIALFFKHFEASLKRFALDEVDFLYLHSINRKESARFEPLIAAMQKLKKEGKARFIGTTTHRNEPEVIRETADMGIYDLVMTAYNFRQPHREDVKKAIAYASAKGLGVVAMKVMAGVYWDIEGKHPINAKAALKWVLQDKNVTTTVPAFATFDQMEEDLSVMEDLKLTPQEKADLKKGETLALNGLYCSQCEKCLPQCRKNLEIPTLMRSYMYAYGYKSTSKARRTLETTAVSRTACRDCSSCGVKCTMGFDVKRKIEDIVRIKDIPGEFLT